MSRRDGVKVTATAESIFGSSHAPYMDMSPLQREDGAYPKQIIVGVSDPGGIVPKRLLLPHQLYTDDALEMLIASGSRKLWVIPIYDPSDWTEIELPADVEFGGRDA